jgi:DNA primase
MDQIFYEKLTDVCHSILQRNPTTYNYLKQRGISEQTIKDYKLGAFPQDLRVLFQRIHPEELLKNNIIYKADKSPFSHYPLVIPIRDSAGKSIAIGCRTLMSEEERKRRCIPKYRNSNYHKASHLFGLDRAIADIRLKNKVFVVEGYFDAISSHQAGARNVVATCGTLFSRRQLITLSRYTDNVVILFDSDEPGKLNAKNVLSKFQDNGLAKLRCVFTPDKYKDIDEYFTLAKTEAKSFLAEV